jgi:diguanylate cyclase (GGDEF)-like protein
VNDTEGHLVGDQLLRAVADIFVSLCGPDAVIARLGGDEFAAIIPGLEELEVDGLLDHMMLAIEGVSAQILPNRHISASMGSSFLGEDGTTVAQLAELADRRMYAMKRCDGSNHRMLQLVRAVS